MKFVATDPSTMKEALLMMTVEKRTKCKIRAAATGSTFRHFSLPTIASMVIVYLLFVLTTAPSFGVVNAQQQHQEEEDQTPSISMLRIQSIVSKFISRVNTTNANEHTSASVLANLPGPLRSPVLNKIPTTSSTTETTLLVQHTKGGLDASGKVPTFVRNAMDGGAPVPVGSVVKRINCGSSTTYTDDSGIVWEPDALNKYYDRGRIYSNFSLAIESTSNDVLYQSERTANQTVTYNIPVLTEGTYSVELHFAEIYFNKAGKRLFDIGIEGVTLITKYDVWKRAGGRGIAIVETYTPIIVTDQFLTISFVTVLNQMKISAIVIRYINDSVALIPTTQAPVPNVAAPIQVPVPLPAGQVQFPVKATDEPAVKLPSVPIAPPLKIPVNVPAVPLPVIIPPANLPLALPVVGAPMKVPTTGSPVVMSPVVTLPVPIVTAPIVNAPSPDVTLPVPIFLAPTVKAPVPTLVSSPFKVPSDVTIPTAPIPVKVPVSVPTIPVAGIPVKVPVPLPVAPVILVPFAIPVPFAQPNMIPILAGPVQVPLKLTNAPVTFPSVPIAPPLTVNLPTAPISVIFPPGTLPVVIPVVGAPMNVPTSPVVKLPVPIFTTMRPTLKPVVPPVNVPVSAPTEFLGVRINCGGNTYTDTVGNIWEADSLNSYFVGGSSYSNNQIPIQGTVDAVIYQSERTGPGIVSYSIGNLPLGYVVVKLHFAEIYWNTAKARLFDVFIEGVKVATQYDVWSEANGNKKAVVETFNAQVVNGNITITFTTILDQMKVSGIEIIPPLPLSPVSPRPSIAPTASLSPTGSPSPTPAPTVAAFDSIFINCGGAAYTDTLGNMWEADFTNSYSSGGFGASNFGLPIQGTEDDVIYQSERTGSGIVSYDIPGLSPGVYNVKLHFAEIYWDAASSRLFDISIEGNKVASNLDVWEMAGGKGVAIVQTYKVDVTDGVLSIVFTSKLDQMKISGIAILIASREPTTSPSISAEPTISLEPSRRTNLPSLSPSTSALPSQHPSTSLEPSISPTVFVFENVFINCGAGPYVDSVGRQWDGDKYFNNGFAASNLGLPIINTLDDNIYQTERTGSGSVIYEIPVPAGEYKVDLHFAEIYWDAGKSRLMDIKLQDKIVATNFDVWTVAGGKGRRVVQEYTVIVEGSTLLIELISKLDQYKISGIVVQRRGDHLAHAVAGGPYAAVDIDGDGFGTVSVDAFQSHTHGLGLVLTKFEWRFNGKVVATTQQANITIPVGSHSITLVVEDDGGNTADTFTDVQIFEVGFPFIDYLSPSSGDVFGGAEVTIYGAGFNWTASDIVVHFGDKELKGSDIVVLDEFRIKIIGVPSSSAGSSVLVSVENPISTSNPKVFSYFAGVPIEFTYGELVAEYGPTTITFGPDGILYVGTLGGDLLKISVDDDMNVISFLKSSIVKIAEGGGRNIMGIAIDPLDVGINPKVYVSHSNLFHGSCEHSAGLAINGKMSVVSGANLDSIEDIVTGLPVSDHDHAPNGIHFGDNGEMYMMIGGNTNAGVPGGLLTGCGEQKENYFSGACLKFDLKRPDFDGFLEYDRVSGNVTKGLGVEVFAPGSRNPWDVVLHSNGYLYSTDNGPNTDYGKKSVDCDNAGIDPNYPDELNVLIEGDYYGHANRKRGEDDYRQCTYYGPDESSIPGVYRAPLLTFPSSTDGIVEWETEHFNGQLRGNLIVGKFVSVLWRVILSQDGLSAPNGPIILHPQGGLDVTQGPDGTLFVAGVGAGKVTYLIPDEAPSQVIVVKASWPRRGPQAGGNILTLYGELMTVEGDPKVAVGGAPCFITTFSETKIKCVLPSGIGKADVTVTSGSTNSTLPVGYRYIAG